VQKLDDGSGGLDVLMSHAELVALLKALNRADAKSAYSWREIPEKPAWRKAHWDKINQDRCASSNKSRD
jgi:hypothetical protein